MSSSSPPGGGEGGEEACLDIVQVSHRTSGGEYLPPCVLTESWPFSVENPESATVLPEKKILSYGVFNLI